ncbi:MAG TPA: hypothetical protein VF065_11940, partial [Ilumatobacter sp.]
MPAPDRVPFRRIRSHTVVALAGVLLLAACAPPAEPVAVASRRTGEATNRIPPDTPPPTTPSTSGPVATSTTVAGEPTAPTTVAAALSRSTSAGDRRYPRLGSADIDVEHYDVSLAYDADAVQLGGEVRLTG